MMEQNTEARSAPEASEGSPSQSNPPAPREGQSPARECWVLWRENGGPCAAMPILDGDPPGLREGYGWIRMVPAPESPSLEAPQAVQGAPTEADNLVPCGNHWPEDDETCPTCQAAIAWEKRFDERMAKAGEGGEKKPTPEAGPDDCPWEIIDWSKDGGILICPKDGDGDQAQWYDPRPEAVGSQVDGEDLAKLMYEWDFGPNRWDGMNEQAIHKGVYRLRAKTIIERLRSLPLSEAPASSPLDPETLITDLERAYTQWVQHGGTANWDRVLSARAALRARLRGGNAPGGAVAPAGIVAAAKVYHEIIGRRHYGRMPEEVQVAHDALGIALKIQAPEPAQPAPGGQGAETLRDYRASKWVDTRMMVHQGKPGCGTCDGHGWITIRHHAYRCLECSDPLVSEGRDFGKILDMVLCAEHKRISKRLRYKIVDKFVERAGLGVKGAVSEGPKDNQTNNQGEN